MCSDKEVKVNNLVGNNNNKQVDDEPLDTNFTDNAKKYLINVLVMTNLQVLCPQVCLNRAKKYFERQCRARGSGM